MQNQSFYGSSKPTLTTISIQNCNAESSSTETNATYF